MIIWNTATREAKIIPILMPFATGRRYSGGRMGFGYDLVGDDYKVVKLMVFRNNPHELVSLVYSLKKNEWTWSRSIQDGFGTSVKDESWLVNGAIHWIGRKETDQEQIVAFDLGAEECHWISLPAKIKYDAEVGVLRGCLCVNYISSYEKGDYDIWMMKNYMKQESWTKLYSINTEFFTRPLAARENGQLLLLEYIENENIRLENKDRLYWYDPSSKKQVQISEFMYTSQIVAAKVSMESLVRVNNYPMITGTRDNKPHLKQRNKRKQASQLLYWLPVWPLGLRRTNVLLFGI
ncbi:hypothetical protein HS088_TW22G01400 [Tripterygium wilfordii]|uniref:F-box associated beta-propeller type 3 domain-containing protein n=1 Tax=Tripterygium wilfordii TaxID=458696 RepID=A0A7J7C0R2_TRIWF|nr:hypothetical protein HS088_TW22G01400 [Tripterygium wilfordii]